MSTDNPETEPKQEDVKPETADGPEAGGAHAVQLVRLVH